VTARVDSPFQALVERMDNATLQAFVDNWADYSRRADYSPQGWQWRVMMREFASRLAIQDARRSA